MPPITGTLQNLTGERQYNFENCLVSRFSCAIHTSFQFPRKCASINGTSLVSTGREPS